MASIMTRRSSWGYLIPFTSCSEKTMSSFPVRWCFTIGWLTWTMFTCLYIAFLRDLYDPPTTSSPIIVLISPTLGLRIVLIFLSLVVNRFLLYLLASLIVFLNKLLELPPLDQLFYLFFQILAFICIMTMVLMEAAVLLRISSLWGRAQWLRPFQGRVVLYLHENLVYKHYQWGEIQLLLWQCLQTTFASLSFCKIILMLLLFALGLCAFVFLSFARQSLCHQRVFPIHVFLCFKQQIRHRGWRSFP